jgi:hypothetical protein
MGTSTIGSYPKATIVPVRHADLELELRQPLVVSKSVTFEDLTGLLKPALFELWRDVVSKQEREDLARARYGLIHRFRSTGHVGREEAESDDFAFKMFLCLSLIKPTRTSFQRIQIKYLENEGIEAFSFQHPKPPPNVPDAESLNFVDLADIYELQRLLPAFLDVVAKGPENVRRAIRHFNVGYNEVYDPTVQIVIWMMGIESLFCSEDRARSSRELIDSISNELGAATDIYGLSPMREYIDRRPFTVGDLIGDLIDLRNRFVHGQWIPKEWKSRVGRSGLSTEVVYADVLREAATFILRAGILRELKRRSVQLELK